MAQLTTRPRSTGTDIWRIRDGRAGGIPEVRRSWLTFAVVGGSPTGVEETAGQITGLARRALKEKFRFSGNHDGARARNLRGDGKNRALPVSRVSAFSPASRTEIGVIYYAGMVQ